MSREKAKQRVKEAVHQSKPDAENTTVFFDPEGKWLFEIYTPKKK